ncbi:MAG: histidine kinase response regulator hybrid protein [Verrucomicrobiales bacterium]|nr:histidine kinase response regulator hybrid protein [Verrucomicrobiales bacterium]
MDREILTVEERLEQCRAQLASNEERWQKLVHFNADGIIVVNGIGLVRFCNPAAETILRRPLPKLMNAPFGFPIVGGETAEIEVTSPEERSVIAEMRGVRIDWENQFGWLISLRDITGHRQAQDEVRELNATLKRRVQELDAFVCSVAHDLRSPLRAIDSFTTILAEECHSAMSSEGHDWMKRIHASIARMSSLLDSLLEFSRFSQMPLKRCQVDLGEVVEALLQEFNATNPRVLKIVTVSRLPVVQGDPTLLRQVLFNLISNAIKYSRSRVHPQIEIGSEIQSTEDCVYVKDNGIGFNMEHSNKLFKVFHRLHAEAEYEGTGIGLAIVERIVTRHGGRIWAEGKLGEGATFYFALPKDAE